MKDTKGKTVPILVAEDDAMTDELLREYFSSLASHIALTVVPDGGRALRFLRTCPPEECPQLILLDYNMPLLNGEEILEKIQDDERYKHVPKIIFSTYITSKMMERCLQFGMTKYISKPVTFKEYPALVAEILALLPSE